MSIKSKLLDKIELAKSTINVDGEELEIRELTGKERADMLQADDNETSTRIAWNAGVVDESEHMDETEFAQAYRFNFNAVNKVVVEICRLSGYLDDIEETEKN